MTLKGFHWGAAAREERAVLNVLRSLHADQSHLRLELEGAGVSFYSVLSLHKNVLAFAKPINLKAKIANGSTVRFQDPRKGGKQIQATVVVPDFKVPLGVVHALVCAVPKRFAGHSGRRHERFNTSRYKNIELTVHSIGRRYRVLDVSQSGVGVIVPDPERANPFASREPVGSGTLRVGRGVSIALDTLVPRSCRNNSVGLQMEVAPDDTSSRFLTHLMQSLDHAERRVLGTTYG